jgi:hypothetical protein
VDKLITLPPQKKKEKQTKPKGLRVWLKFSALAHKLKALCSIPSGTKRKKKERKRERKKDLVNTIDISRHLRKADYNHGETLVCNNKARWL